YVESRMVFIAPNLTAVCGSATAARLMGLAGGLKGLAQMPACNVEVLGASKKNLSGFSTAHMLPHTGFVYYCGMAVVLKIGHIPYAYAVLASRMPREYNSGWVGL
ncbi:hypothetical protein SARC_09429, partial [Sphaeroforma arctica JP610]